MMFCKEYNARTQDQAGMIIPVEITVFEVLARSRQIGPPPTETNILARDAFSRTTRLKTQWLTHFLIHSSQTPSRLQDKSFTFVLKTPPAAVLIKKAAGISKGAAKGVGEKVGSITRDQLEEIAKTKLPDLNADKIESAMRIVAGTAHNMGVTIEGWDIEESKAGFREEKAAIWGLKPEQLTQA